MLNRKRPYCTPLLAIIYDSLLLRLGGLLDLDLDLDSLLPLLFRTGNALLLRLRLRLSSLALAFPFPFAPRGGDAERSTLDV
jgi:hypothetical protein